MSVSLGLVFLYCWRTIAPIAEEKTTSPNKEEVVPAIRLMFELLSQSRRGLSAFGDSRRHRKCLEQENEELREQLQNNPSNTTNLRSALDQQRRVINDIHKRAIAVTKGLEKQPR